MNLLIVDDQPFEIENILQNIDFENTDITYTYKAYNGEEAKELLKENKIDILLSDIEMPSCNGLELLEWARDREMPLECIFLTSFPDFSYAKKAIALECLDYILKPVSRENLNDVLNKAIQKILIKRTQSMEHHYSSLWFSHQPYLIDALWADLLNGKIPPTQEAVRQQMYALNFPGMEVMKILPVLIHIQESDIPTGASRRVIISSTIKAIAQDAILHQTGYGTLIEYRPNQYFLIVYEEFGFENPTDRLIRGCEKFLEDCRQILHFTPCCYLGKEIYAFQLKELAQYLLSASHNTLNKAPYIFPFSTWKEYHHPVVMPDLTVVAAFFKNRRFTDIIRYYTDYFDETLKKHVSISRQLFIIKQDFLQLFYNFVRENEMNMNAFWENGTIQTAYLHADRSVNDFILLITEFINCLSEKLELFKQPQNVIDQAIAYIKEHLNEDISREDVAHEVCMNSDYFAKIFKKKTGMLISEYILKCRMEQATELLKTDMSILNIAMALGFNSSTYFSTQFKKYFGKSPNEYRHLSD